jgi:hypothetical protein
VQQLLHPKSNGGEDEKGRLAVVRDAKLSQLSRETNDSVEGVQICAVGSTIRNDAPVDEFGDENNISRCWQAVLFDFDGVTN